MNRCALVGLLLVGCGDDDDVVYDAAPPPADAATPDAAIPDAGPDAVPGPDLTLNRARAIADISIEEKNFAADSCELDPDEACIGAPGDRRLLRFSVETPNIGQRDLFLGTPEPTSPLFQFSECHGHYHFNGYASYYLETPEGTLVAPGHKQAFCLLDWQRFDHDDPTVTDEAAYHCGLQGIQRGWSDVYEARLSCQYVDITGIPDGDYVLRVDVNSEQTLYEMSYANNTISLPVTIGDPNLATPTEPCPAEVDSFGGDGLHRECDWDFMGTFDCNPGNVTIACAAECGLGSCTDDPMMRVCDNADPDGNCSASDNLRDDDDSCGGTCPRVRNIPCPASGKLDVYAAPFAVGGTYTCNVAIQ